VRPLGVARLPDYILRWNKLSKKDGSGKCNIVFLLGSEVLGTAYDIDERKSHVLDDFEGAGFGYKRVNIRVSVKAALIDVMTYVATSTDDAILPYDWYRDFVIAGARLHGLPVAYIDDLLKQPIKVDEDEVRASSERLQLELRPRSA